MCLEHFADAQSQCGRPCEFIAFLDLTPSLGVGWWMVKKRIKIAEFRRFAIGPRLPHLRGRSNPNCPIATPYKTTVVVALEPLGKNATRVHMALFEWVGSMHRQHDRMHPWLAQIRHVHITLSQWCPNTPVIST